MDVHRDLLVPLLPAVFGFVSAIGDEPAKPLGALGGPDFDDMVDEWGAQSFPASDPPSNW